VRAEFYAPPEQFDGCFTSFYRLLLDVPQGGTLIDHLQPEWANIRFFSGAMPDATLGSQRLAAARFVATGPSSLPCRFELGSVRMWGIGFLPIGWARFMGEDASCCANLICDGGKHPAFSRFDILTSALTAANGDPEEQLARLTQTLTALMRPNRDEPKIARIHAALVAGESTSVADLADACAMSIRTLERVCLRYFGFTPKLLMRRQRFMRTLSVFMLKARGSGMRWTEAMDADYHDQAQFTREFREFMTMLPSEYAALDHPILAAFMEARTRLWGSAAQTLDPQDRRG
jgi:AraC-like DNA-binding protein